MLLHHHKRVDDSVRMIYQSRRNLSKETVVRSGVSLSVARPIGTRWEWAEVHRWKTTSHRKQITHALKRMQKLFSFLAGNILSRHLSDRVEESACQGCA